MIQVADVGVGISGQEGMQVRVNSVSSRWRSWDRDMNVEEKYFSFYILFVFLLLFSQVKFRLSQRAINRSAYVVPSQETEQREAAQFELFCVRFTYKVSEYLWNLL